MRSISGKRIWIVMSVLAVCVIGLGSVVALFITAKMSSGILNREPTYTSQELYEKALVQAEKGSYKEAESYLTEALTKDDNLTTRSQLAVVQYQLKKYPEAIEQYSSLVNSGQDASFAWNGIGNCYRDWAASSDQNKAERVQLAIDAYTKSYTLNPAYVAAYSNLALLYFGQNNLLDAIKVLDKGISTTGSQELQQVKKNIQQS